jgi:replication fork protection complex subunit Csm3/Swi3
LFKKAKFRDTLAIIEKLGHTRGIKKVREEWIGERRHEARENAGVRAEDPKELQKRIERRAAKRVVDGDDEDDLYTTPATNDKGKGKETETRDPNALFLGGGQNSDDDMPDGDDDDFDIEALKALEAAGTTDTTGPTSTITAGTSSTVAAISSTSKPAAVEEEEDYFGDDDDDFMDFADANIIPPVTARKVDEDNDEMEILRAMEEQAKEKQRTQKNVDDDDEDALAAMMEIEN